jgi:GNAT superfamily N-acetyltransferase
MHRYQEEGLTSTLMAEVDTVMTDLYENTPARTNRPPFDFDWQMYIALQDRMVITTVRDDDSALLGFAFYIVMHHTHHASTVVAECDSIIVRPEHRGKGIATRLYEFTEPLLVSLGAEYITHRSRVVYGAEPMFPKLGFELEEHVYIKRMN